VGVEVGQREILGEVGKEDVVKVACKVGKSPVNDNITCVGTKEQLTKEIRRINPTMHFILVCMAEEQPQLATPLSFTSETHP
jgi:hypothetical protein